MTNFGRVIKDCELATNDHQNKSGHWFVYFGHFFKVINLSFSTSVQTPSTTVLPKLRMLDMFIEI